MYTLTIRSTGSHQWLSLHVFPRMLLYRWYPQSEIRSLDHTEKKGTERIF
jgi:hypothetical protein